MSPRTQSRPSTGRKTKQAGIKKVRGPYRKGGAAARARLPYTKKTQPRKMSVTSSEDSDDALAEMQDGAELEDDDNNDAEDESDVSAPSYDSRKNIKAGPGNDEEIKEPMMFDSEEEKEAWFGDSEDDDEIYEGVDDISDDEDVSVPVEEEFLAAQFYDHPDVAANFLGDLDGYSIFGFENDLDRHSFSSSSDSSDEVVAERRVHFESDVEDFPLNPESPEMTALMTRGLPAPFTKEELRESSQSRELSAAHRAFLGDPDEDSDLTDEELPAQAHTASPSALQNDLAFEDDEGAKSPSSPKKDKENKQAERRRGPTLGVFEFDGDKPWAVLDPSGTKVHIAPAPDTNRHDWLEKKAQHVMNQLLGIGSAESSPRGSLATLLDDSDRSVSSSQENADAIIYGGANVMMAGLNSGNQHGLATGPPEAFYPPNGQFMGDFLLADDDLDLDDDDRRDPTGEGRLNIADFIICGGDSDEEDEKEDDSTPASPTRLPAVGLSTPTHKKADSWSHLNSDNVLSFRRNADPSSASRNQPWNFDLTPLTPGPNFPSSPIPRKRKARSPPYQGEHYRDVTVVERKLITPKPKRRRANTTL